MNTGREKLIDSIGEISDQYIEEALEKRAGHRRLFRKTAAAAAVFLLLAAGVYGIVGKGSFAPADNGGTGTSLLTVVAYAQEAEDENAENAGRELEEEVAVEFSEYAPWMSSVPDMPFSFSYDEQESEVDIVAAADTPGTLKIYRVTDEGIWQVEEAGSSLHLQPGQKVYWNSGGAEGGITVEVYVDGTCVETKYIAIRSNQAGKYTAVLKSKKGEESKKEILGESMEFGQHISAYAPELLVCNRDYLAFANLRGMVIYDRKEERVASVVDLQELDANNFDSHSRHTRVMPEDGGMLLFNESQGKAENAYYRLRFPEGLDRPELTRCECEGQEGEKLLKKYREYRKHFIQETSWQYVRSHTRKESFFSEYAICWEDGEGCSRRSCLLVEYSSLAEREIYYALLSKNKKTGETEKEKLNISVSVEKKEPQTAQRSPFAYTGKDEVKRAVLRYIVEEDFPDRDYHMDFHKPGRVMLPVIREEYGRFQRKGEVVCIAQLFLEDFRVNGDILEGESGTEMTAKFILKRQGDGYRVRKMKAATGGGAMYYDSVLRLMKGYPAARRKFLGSGYDEQEVKKETRRMLRMYVRQNDLDIKYYKEFGWDKVRL